MEKYNQAISRAKALIKDPMLLNSKVSTYAIHSGHVAHEHPGTGHPIIPPISLSTTFWQRAPCDFIKYDYSRAGNYNRDILESTIAAMDNAKYCCVFSSGLATLSSITQTLKSGDHILCYHDVYGGTGRYFNKVASRFNITCDMIDMQDIELFQRSLKPNTKMIWIETPSNPLMQIVDIKQISKLSKIHNPEILVVVDNTFLTPIFQLPIELGADVSMYSLTKYMNGHSDVIMGAAATNNEDLYKSLQQQQLMVGAVSSPFDCYLALRGLRTLTVRMNQHQLNALAVALYLADHPKIKKVHHPALFGSPSKELIEQQMKGYCGMLSVCINGSTEDTLKFINDLKYFQLAESLGGFESLVEVPSLMTHASVPPDLREKLGITDNLVRISVGLENIYSLLEDLDQALNKIK